MLLIIKDEDTKKVFPQANDIHKLIKYVDKKTYNYHEDKLKRVSLDYVDRQEAYYKSAAQYLNLIENNKPTNLAMHIFKFDKNEVFVNLAQLILEHKIFYDYYANRNIEQTINYLIKEYKLNHSTAKRRANTVKAWVKWCENIIKENNILIEVSIDGHN